MDLNRVATFLHVVEARGFTAAAKLMQVPTSSVSRSVARLEKDLGLVLLERTTRTLALTDAGKAFYERAREAVTGIQEATTLAGEAAQEVSGMVRVAAPPDVVCKLVAVLGAFLELHPNVRVDVVTTSRGAELVGADVDVAIVLGRLQDSSLIVRRLGTSVHRLYASKEYLARRGTPRRLGDLVQHDAVLYRGDDGRGVWDLTGPRGAETVEVTGALSGDSYDFVVEAIAAGHGIGLVPEQMIDRTSTTVSVVPVLPQFTAQGALQSLVLPSRHLPRRVKLLRDFLTEHMVCCGERRRA